MKITINEQDFFISWRHDAFLTSTSNYMLRGMSVTCVIKKKVPKPEEGQKPEKSIVIEKTVNEKLCDVTTKRALRTISLRKTLDAWKEITKGQKEYIWNVFINSQHGNISSNKPTLKSIKKAIQSLSPEQRESIRTRFFEQKVGAVVKKMNANIDDEAIHSHA